MRGLAARLRRVDLLICADGGLVVARRTGVPPHVVVGDLDSARAALLQWAVSRGARLLRHPVEKDKTDTELALDAAVAGGATEVEFLGVLGGRVDHTLANVALLIKAKSARVRARIFDGRQELFLADKVTKVSGRRGEVVSLIPLTPTITGVTLQGFKYPLSMATIKQGSTLAISNVLETNPATVRVGRGRLLVVVTHQ